METTGLDVATKQHASKLIHNVAIDKPTVFGWMVAMDSYHGKKASPRVQKLKMTGGKMVFNYWTQIPEWEGVDRESNDWNETMIDIQPQHEIIQSGIKPSGYQCAIPIRKRELEAIQDDAPFRNFIKQLAEKGTEGLYENLNNHLWPAASQVGGTTAYDRTNTRIMSFAMGLQSGYAGNALTGTGTYMYMGVDLNAHPRMKAINVGTDSQGWVVSGAAVKRDLIRPLRTRGSNIDTILVDNDVYSALEAELFDTVRQAPADTIRFPGEFFQMANGIFVVYEPKLDDLPVREMYVGDSSTLRFGMLPDVIGDMDLITKVPKQPTKYLLQGDVSLGFVNERPDLWARAYNVLLAGE